MATRRNTDSQRCVVRDERTWYSLSTSSSSRANSLPVVHV